MPTRVWTHPTHKYPAFAALCFDISAFMFTASAVFQCLYTNRAGHCSKMIDTNVECTNTICKYKHGYSAFSTFDWQNTAFMLTAIAFAIDFTSVGLQLLVFWPLALARGVFRFILRTCSILDFTSGVLKFIVAWTLLIKQVTINKAYRAEERDALKMLLIPSACLQFSLILSFVAMLLLRVATDRGPPNGPTYLESIDAKKKEEKIMRAIGSKASQYRPQSVISVGRPSMAERRQFSSTSV